jgi:hypothetical protein
MRFKSVDVADVAGAAADPDDTLCATFLQREETAVAPAVLTP